MTIEVRFTLEVQKYHHRGANITIEVQSKRHNLCLFIHDWIWNQKPSNTYHLGCDYKRDEDGTLAMGLVRYIERMAEGYERTFGTKPRQSYRSPLEPNDHPELDDTTLLEMDGIVKQYQSMHQRSASYVWQAFFVIVTKISNMLGYPT